MTDMFLGKTEASEAASCFGSPSHICGNSTDRKRKHLLFSSEKRLKHKRSGEANNQNDDVESDLLARDLNEMSFDERERVSEEVHGVAKTPEETPEFVKAAMEAFDRAIEVVPKYKRQAMEKAFFLRPSFATDVQFKLLFFRADDFDPTDAVTRMIAYFETKRLLFGDDKLAKKTITLEDLSQEDIEKTFLSGCFGVPEVGRHYKDAIGRPIVFVDSSKYDINNYLNMVGTKRGAGRFLLFVVASWYIFYSMALLTTNVRASSQSVL
jgi:hypothetical protein